MMIMVIKAVTVTCNVNRGLIHSSLVPASVGPAPPRARAAPPSKSVGGAGAGRVEEGGGGGGITARTTSMSTSITLITARRIAGIGVVGVIIVVIAMGVVVRRSSVRVMIVVNRPPSVALLEDGAGGRDSYHSHGGYSANPAVGIARRRIPPGRVCGPRLPRTASMVI
jgi:hypothetical protein